jgi:DNA-binding transcriptional LysR family regulator
MLYDTVLLRTFATVCDLGSFTKAARRVHLTQSAVSLHIKRLEEQVGARLISRQARGILLTEHGEVLLSYARRILALHNEAAHRLRLDGAGIVRLGAPEYFNLHALSSLIGEFTALYAGVQLQLKVGIGPDIVALLDEGQLDMAIVSSEIGEAAGIALCRERRVWAAGRAMSLSPDTPAPLAVYPPYCRWRQVALDHLDRAGRSWAVVLQSTGATGILVALDAGIAITIFPECLLEMSTLKSLGLAEGLPTLPDFEFVLRRNGRESPAADQLAQLIINRFKLSTGQRTGNGMGQKLRDVCGLAPETRHDPGSLNGSQPRGSS